MQSANYGHPNAIKYAIVLIKEIQQKQLLKDDTKARLSADYLEQLIKPNNRLALAFWTEEDFELARPILQEFDKEKVYCEDWRANEYDDQGNLLAVHQGDKPEVWTWLDSIPTTALFPLLCRIKALPLSKPAQYQYHVPVNGLIVAEGEI